MRYYRAAILDNDGEEHSYYFSASNLWMVTNHIMVKMQLQGDFYGHKKEDTIELSVHETVEINPNSIKLS